MSELSLDDDQRDPFTRHLYRMSVPELVWCEPASDTRACGGLVQLRADPSRSARAPLGRAANHAEQPADRQLVSQLEPRIQVRPRPVIHANFAALVPLAVPYD